MVVLLCINFAGELLCYNLIDKVRMPPLVVGELGMKARGDEVILLDSNNAVLFISQSAYDFDRWRVHLDNARSSDEYAMTFILAER